MRARKIIPSALVLTTLLATFASAPAHAATARGQILSRVNAIRTDHGLRRLDCVAPVDRLAQSHSAQMARSRNLFHTPNLYSKLRSRVRLTSWGENVGYATNWWRVVTLWMRSPSHRRNMLNGRFRRCGIGVAQAGGRSWLTLIFVG
jgi:uncharacterized protein YkwD